MEQSPKLIPINKQQCRYSNCPIEAYLKNDLCFLHIKKDNKSKEVLVRSLHAYKESGQKKIIGAYLRLADFSGLRIREKTFQHCDFTGASFYGARLYKVGFDFTTIDDVNFEEVILERVDLRKVKSAEGIMLFHAVLDRALLPPIEVLGEKTVYDLIKCREPKKALDVYQKLKENYKQQGALIATGLLFELEMDRRRETGNFKDTIWLSSLWLLCGYGERPGRAFLSFITTILMFAGIYFQLTLIGPKEVVIHNDLGNALYFSVVTFTSLGYGDIRPIGIAKAFAGIEALMGIFLISLFVFVFCRKMVR